MQYYISNLSMLSDIRMNALINSESKKQRTLILFAEDGTMLTLDEHIFLQNASKKFKIEYRKINSNDELMLAIGMLFGSANAKDEFFTILNDDFTIPSFLSDKFIIQNYKTVTKINASKSTKTSKNTKEVKKAEPIKKEEKVEIVQENNEDDLLVEKLSKIEEKEKKEKKTNNTSKEIVVSKSKKDVSLPSVKEGTDRNLFIKLIELTPEKAKFNGTIDEMVLAIGDVMIKVRDTGANLQSELLNKFGKESGTIIYKSVQSKYMILLSTLRK